MEELLLQYLRDNEVRVNGCGWKQKYNVLSIERWEKTHEGYRVVFEVYNDTYEMEESEVCYLTTEEILVYIWEKK